MCVCVRAHNCQINEQTGYSFFNSRGKCICLHIKNKQYSPDFKNQRIYLTQELFCPINSEMMTIDKSEID